MQIGQNGELFKIWIFAKNKIVIISLNKSYNKLYYGFITVY